MTACREDATVRSPLTSEDPPLALDGVTRTYGSTLALAPLSLTVHPGSLCLVTGANGSGKTTLLRLAAGVLAPTGGERRAARPACYLRAGDGARSPQRVSEAVGFAAALGGGDVSTALSSTGLEALESRRARELSAGQRARLTLAVALACRPALACLDEPTAHLDADGVSCALEVLAGLADGGAAVLVATHDAESLLGHADGVLRLRDGYLETAQ